MQMFLNPYCFVEIGFHFNKDKRFQIFFNKSQITYIDHNKQTTKA